MTEEEYNQIIVGDKHDWYKRAAQDYITNVPIFIGSRLKEPILAAELDRARKSAGEGLGRAFLITPDDFTPLQLQGFRAKKIVVLKATLADFVTWLRATFPTGISASDAAASSSEFSGIAAGRLDAATIDFETASSIYPIKIDRIRAQANALTNQEHDRLAQQFLMGSPPTWKIAATDIPVWLTNTTKLENALTQAIDRRDRVFVVTGQSGSGKTTATMQSLLKISLNRPEIVLYEFRSDIRSLRSAFNLLARLHPNEHVVAYIGDAFLYGDSLQEDITSVDAGRITVVAGARTGEWNEHLERHLGELCEPFSFQRFVGADFQPLIDQLVRYVPSPRFKKLNPSERLQKMHRSNSQLLIALREATESENFSEVIAREYQDLTSDAARMLLLLVGVATLARVGLGHGVAREAFSRLVRDESFENTLRALEGIVLEGPNGRLVARHELYVRHVLENVASFDLLFKIVVELLRTFTKYPAPIVKSVHREDMILFKFVINHNFLKETFAKKGRAKDGVNVYKEFEVGFQLDGHFWLQYGQYLKEIGRIEDALTMLRRSNDAYSNNKYALHAYAEVELIVASRRPDFGPGTTKLIDHAVTTLLAQDASEDASWDQYPIVTLAYEHVGALIAHNQSDAARKAANQYFDRIQFLERRISVTALRRAKERLAQFLTFGHWPKSYRIDRRRARRGKSQQGSRSSRK